MGEVAIDEALLLSRLTRLAEYFSAHPASFGGAAVLQALHGKPVVGDVETPHSVTLQTHLLGYEFPDTVLLLVRDASGTRLIVHATAKKLEYLRGAAARAAAARAAGGGVVLELVAREKGEANAAAMGTLVAAIKAAGGVVAKFDDDSVAGSAVAQAWVDDLAAAGVTTVDGTRGLDEALAVKDVAGVEQVTKAGHLTARVGRAVWLKAMERAIESGADVTNASLATEVAESLDNLKAAGVKVDTDSFDWLQAPVVQSGGSYGAVLSRAGARSSDARFSADVVLFSQALKYKSHAAFLARTYLIDPTPSQTRAYDALVRAHDALVEKLRPGVTVREAHAAAVAVFIDAKLPEAAKLPKTFGSGFGLRASEKHLVISGKNGAVVEAGMVFNVCVGLSELPLSDPPRGAKAADAAMAKLKSYALLLANTVVVTASGTEVVTDKLPSDRAQIVFSLAGGDEDEDDDEEEEEEDEDAGGRAAARAKAKAKAAAAAAAAPARSTRLAARKQEVDENMEAAARRDEHQKELFASKKAAALRRLAGDDDSGAGGGSARDDAEEVRTAPDIAAYGSTADFPRSGLRPCQISVDKAHSAVLLPVFGSLVPFHVSTIKSAVKSEEGAKALLRINFYAPGQAPGKECAASMQAAMLRHPSAIFVRTLSYMSKEHRNMANVVALIKSMQKTIKVEREAAAQRAGLQEQPKLRLTTDAKFPRLMDLNMWPAISGRKTTGAIEAHTNGLRFLSSKGERVEIIYANVRHGIFQPCEKEHVVLVHFHLKHAIMIGKKKYKDIQFFTEVVEASQAIDGRHRSDYDADEIGEEDRERKMRQEMNKAFKKFCERVEQVAEKDPASAWNKFDVPQRELSFPGAPQREMVTLLPCSDCIVSLVDKPPFVVSLADVEHVHFERVTFTNKDFDLVFVFKEGVRDKGEDEFVRIASIPMRGHLDPIKTWLDEIADMTYTEGVNNFNWKSIIEDVVRQPDFWQSADADTGEEKPAGWDFLRDEEKASDEDDDDDEESEEYSEEDDDDSDDDAGLSDLEDEDEDSPEDDDDDDGESWEKMEKEAEEEDEREARDQKRKRPGADDGGRASKKAKR